MADFGLATQVKEVVKNNEYSTQMLTIAYAAPERINSEDYGEPYDLWSIGCILYELCLLKKPFERNMSKILNVDYDRKAMDNINPFFKLLIEEVLIFEQEERLDINEFCELLNTNDIN